MSISQVAAQAVNPLVAASTAAAARTGNFPTATAACPTPPAPSTAATGSADSFQGLTAELQAMLLQMQGNAASPTTAAGTAATTTTSTNSTAAATTTSAANLSQSLSGSIQQALQAYASGSASSALPSLNF